MCNTKSKYTQTLNWGTSGWESKLKRGRKGRWLTPVILAIQGEEIRRIVV
jgi:hypothetical protein